MERAERGFFMLLKAINQYWILYGMVGIFGIGIISRLWLNQIYKSIMKDTFRPGEPRKKFTRQFKKSYLSYTRENSEIPNLEVFIKKNLYGHRFFGMTIDTIKRISGEALFLCFVLGIISAAYAYYKNAGGETVIVHILAAIGMAIGIIDINWLLNARRKQQQVEIGLIDYIENNLINMVELSEEEEEEEQMEADEEEIDSRYRQEERKTRMRHTSKGLEPDIEYLKSSLDQIAADMEKGKREGTYIPSEEDEKVIREIIHEFLG